MTRQGWRRIVAGVAAGTLCATIVSAAGAADPSTPIHVASLDTAVRAACPNGFVAPPAVESVLRSFSDDEFQRLVDLASDARIIDTEPPPILGDDEADRRIRSLAEARGYRQRTDVGVGGLAIASGRFLEPETARAWISLASNGRSDGVALFLSSGYRSVTRQRAIFNGKLFSAGHGSSSVRAGSADAAIDGVLRFSSIPGYSRHHTGTTIDVLSPGYSTATFGSSPASAWLSVDNFANAKRHGFVPSYPPNAGRQGPEPEPWEFVYVGVEALTASSDLGVIGAIELVDGVVTVSGVAADLEHRYSLYLDDVEIADASAACQPGGGPGIFHLTAEVDPAADGDLCVVQHSGDVDRLLGCRT